MRDRVARPVRLRHPAPFPGAFQHLQVALPAARGVDAHAVVVDLAEDVDPGTIDAAVRRHWWSADQGQLAVRRSSARALEAEGAHVLRVADLGWVDRAERGLPGFPLADDDPDRERLWVPGRRSDDAVGWMPYTAVVARPGDARPDEPLSHPPLLVGLGAGADAAEARAAAIRTVAAEDALWCWWAGLAEATAMTPAPETAVLWSDADLRLDLLRTADAGLGPATIAVVDDGDIATVGAAGGGGHGAEREAIARALWQLVLARALADPADPVHAMGVPGLAAVRADRAYAPPDAVARRRLLDPLAHVQLTLDPRVRGFLRTRVSVASRTEPSPDGTPLPPWVADLCGDGTVVRALVPGAVPLPLGAFRLDPELVQSAADRHGAAARGAGPQPLVPAW